MIAGFAIVSKDGYIAEPNGNMSRILHDEDFSRLQNALSAPDTIGIMGRTTHECHPNRRNRQRWILSTTFTSANTTDRERLFTDMQQIEDALQTHKDTTFYILGGSTIYGQIGQKGLYSEFNLSVRTDVELKDGLPLDSKAKSHSIDTVMNGWGLTLVKTEICPQDPNLEFRKYAPPI